MGWESYLFEYVIDFIEVLVSCYFATRFYGKKVSEKRRVLLLSSLAGGTCMFLREMGVVPVPDFAVPVGVLFLYVWRICCAKVGAAAFLAVLNYFLLGVVNIFVPSFLQLFFRIDNRPGVLEHENRILIVVIIHLMQLAVVEIILKFQERFFGDASRRHQVNAWILLMPFSSILVLAFLQHVLYHRTQEAAYYFSLFSSVLIMIGNLA